MLVQSKSNIKIVKGVPTQKYIWRTGYKQGLFQALDFSKIKTLSFEVSRFPQNVSSRPKSEIVSLSSISSKLLRNTKYWNPTYTWYYKDEQYLVQSFLFNTWVKKLTYKRLADKTQFKIDFLWLYNRYQISVFENFPDKNF